MSVFVVESDWLTAIWIFENFCLNRTYVKIRFVKTTNPFCFTQFWSQTVYQSEKLVSFTWLKQWVISYDSLIMRHKAAVNIVVRGETVWCSGPKMTCLFVQVGVIKIFETFLGKFLNLNLHTAWECISRNQNHSFVNS